MTENERPARRFRVRAAITAAAAVLLAATACTTVADNVSENIIDTAEDAAGITQPTAEPGTGDAAQPAPDADPGTGDADSTTADTTPANDAEATPADAEPTPEPDPDAAPADPATGDDVEAAPDTPAASDTEPTTGTASDDSPAPEIRRTPGALLKDGWYYDHAAIAALFPECPPDPQPADHWTRRVFDYWDETFAGWDLEARVLTPGGPAIAAGWWTDEQLERAYPGLGYTAESAREHARYIAARNAIYLWPPDAAGSLEALKDRGVRYAPQDFGDGDYAFGNLFRRLAAAGYTNPETDDDVFPYIRDDGASGVNQPDTNIGELLWEWMLTRYQYPPTVHEPAAWAMRTLLTAREAGCVAESMQDVCDSGEGDGLLARADRFGRVLWSLVCPDA